MSESKGNNNSLRLLMDVLLDRLLDDKELRRSFFADPLVGAEKLGVSLDSEAISLLRNFQCPLVSSNVAKFNEKLVLCSSSPA